MNVRALALTLLERIEAGGGYSNIALDTEIKRTGIVGHDRALLTALVYGVIERRITLDRIIDGMASIPPSKIEKRTRYILRMGLYQLAFMSGIPDHAAINESVSLAGGRSKGFVNALLRNFVRSGKEIPLPSRENGEAEYISVKYSFPAELCELFIGEFGSERAEEILSAMSGGAPMTLRVNTLKLSREELLGRLEASGVRAERTEISPYGIKIIDRGEGFSFDDGESLFFVQDEASQICACVTDAKSGDLVVDTCACPGGKSFSMAMMMGNVGSVRAFDIHENKLSLIRSGAERLGIDIISTAAADGRDPDPELFGRADVVLCDVPCSGFGVMAKKPEIRYKDLGDTERLPRVQLEIAENSIKYLKKGGVMVYSTCTLLRRENEDVVKQLTEKHPEMKLVPFDVGNIHAESGTYTLLPSSYGTDGFFISKLIKT